MLRCKIFGVLILLFCSVRLVEANWVPVDRSANPAENLALDYDPSSLQNITNTVKRLVFRYTRINPNLPIAPGAVPASSEASLFYAELDCLRMTIRSIATQEQLWGGELTPSKSYTSSPKYIPEGSMFDSLSKRVCF